MSDHPASGCVGVVLALAGTAALLYFDKPTLAIIYWVGCCTSGIFTALDRHAQQRRDDEQVYDQIHERRMQQLMSAIARRDDR